MEIKKSPHKYAKINHLTFWVSVAACIAFYGPMVIFQKQVEKPFTQLFFIVTHSTDWVWEFVVFGGFVFLLWLAFGRYGNVKLGGPDDKSEFSTFTWISMMFCGGCGAGLVYWSLIEPLWYLAYPPFWLEPLSPQAAQFSLAYGIFHWGFSAWGTYGIPAVAFAYMYYVRRKPYLYASYACRDVLGKVADGWVGKLIDASVIVGIVGGTATSLGFIIPMLSRLSAEYLGIQDTMGFKIIVAILFSCLYGYSCYRGLYGGIAKLADYNMYLTFIILGFVLLAGPTMFMLSLFCDNFGVLVQNFVRMSFYTDPITKSGFPQDWTVFYWAWWIAWAIYIGLFAARISKGRTIRGLILNMVFSATAGCMLIFLIFGGYQVDLVMNKGVQLTKILQDQGGPAVISYFLNTLPLKAIIIPFFIFVMAVSQATGIDAASYTIANMSCYEVRDGVEPPRWARVFWAAIVFFATVGLLIVNAMNVVKLSTVITVIPVLFLMIILAVSIVKWLREDFGYGTQLVTTKYLHEETK
ncbi:BCCT family transporter [Candidatus Formimonas warabiya]|uniref:Choline/carnitine/betaine transporter n=1 Tax=Formimonas warabiya TaxID=1761012 RepID=A0A3G1KZ04_FORW1|nr:BCCT family transporter [Candidatus Formimonas warabiya]ATW27445.1 choline/carnitine/betaine transporter [Candidatus Formimonas warabiya]